MALLRLHFIMNHNPNIPLITCIKAGKACNDKCKFINSSEVRVSGMTDVNNNQTIIGKRLA